MTSQIRTSDSVPATPLEHAHTPGAIRERLTSGPRHSYLRDFIYGGIDGAVTTFAVVSGVAGARLASGIVVVLGLANLLADGFSMAASNYLGTKADEQQRDRLRRMEERHIDQVPDGEREEIRQIFASQGFAGQDLERAVGIVTADRRRWVDVMLKDEHGIALTGPSSLRSAAATFVAFLVVGLLPVLPFLIAASGRPLPGNLYVWSTILTGAAFFAVGAFKSRFVDQSWLTAGVQTLLVASAAAGLAYACGAWLGHVMT
jgi:VIT1/CCC1 family predicted Fe2+/Mn2+ transporter